MKFWIIIISLLAFSCQTVLDVDVPTIPEKAVLFASFNSVDQNHKVVLTKSRPAISNAPSNEFEVIANAKVEVIGNGEVYEFVFVDDEYVNTKPFSLVANENYSIRAVLANGSVVSSIQTMPGIPQNLEYTLDSSESDWGTTYNLEMKWLDKEGSTNFYRIEAYSVVDNDTQQVFVSNEYLDDSKAKNGVLQSKAELFPFVFIDGEPRDDYSLFLVISEINKDHYDYGIALETYNPQNPFSEPKPLPKNVEGGLGMFTLSGSRVVSIR